MSNSFDSSVYVDTLALTNWSSQMASINEAAVSDLETFIKQVKELDNSWAGNSATGFLNNTSKFINDAINSHNTMGDVENFLITVINTMESQ